MAEKTGRKPLKINYNRVRQMASRGMTHKQIAAALGISEATLYKYKKEKTEFLEAIVGGQAEGIEEVTNALFENCLNGNPQSQQFYLKNRAGWKDKMDHDVDGSLNFDIKVKYV